MKIKFLTIALIAIVFYSCGPSKATKMAEAEKAALIVKQNEGKALYENACGKCHRLPDPKRYTGLEWQPVLKKMQPKAKLQDADMDKILAYLSK